MRVNILGHLFPFTLLMVFRPKIHDNLEAVLGHPKLQAARTPLELEELTALAAAAHLGPLATDALVHALAEENIVIISFKTL